MNIDDKFVMDIGKSILCCKKVVENDWDSLVFVFDAAEGHIANSGFLYSLDSVRPASARIESDPMLLNNQIRDLREKIFDQCNAKFRQMLVQMESQSGRIKIDFEFDDPSRWTIKPSNIKQMREELRPNFED